MMRRSGKRNLVWAVAAICLAVVPAFALAKPGDAASVARARKDYAEAMKGKDPGLQNARHAELEYQLSLARNHHQYIAKHKRYKARASVRAKVAGVEENHSR